MTDDVAGQGRQALAGGTWWIAPTPFAEDGSVDGDALEHAVRTAAGWGVDGVTVLGVMGEVTSLSDAERDVVLAAVSRGAGDLPFAAGCSAASARLVAERAAQAREHGAVAAMVAAPPLVRDADTVVAFFGAVGERGWVRRLRKKGKGRRRMGRETMEEWLVLSLCEMADFLLTHVRALV